jgi:hypothetical protein
MRFELSNKEWQDMFREVGYEVKRVSDNVQYVILVREHGLPDSIYTYIFTNQKIQFG